MFKFRTFILVSMLLCSTVSTAFAEGFAMSTWSARGVGLAGGLVGRADDVSTLAYNPAGITQLPGTHMMAGMSFDAPYGSISSGYGHTTNSKTQIWVPPHAYMSHQLNDSMWLGLAVHSRFGLGNTYADDWFGKYSVYTVGLQTFSVVPTFAYKFNDMFSASVGIELMHMSMYLGQKINLAAAGLPENDVFLEGDGMGIGFQLGLHAKFSEQWSAGISYKSQVRQNITGTADYAQDYSHLGGLSASLGAMHDGDIYGAINLPDSVAFGLTYKPLDNLSFEVGAVWTRWSSYDALNIYFADSEVHSNNDKNWSDGWNFNISAEYAPLDWLTLRAGYYHETPVTNENYADFMMPTNGRDVVTLGMGFKYENWTADIAYAHIWVYPTDYSQSRAHGVKGAYNGAQSSNVGADIYSFSIGYSF